MRSWDDMSLLWEHSLGLLGLSNDDNAERKILQTESTLTSCRAREKIIEISLETFGFGHAFISLQGVLALYSQGMLLML